MTLPVGTISLSQVNVELGLSSTALISMNDTAVRALAGVASGAISMSDLQGKSSAFAFTISSNQTDANLRTLAVAAGWDQVLAVVATIGSGVVISGSVLSNSTPALTIDGAWAGGVRLVNNGTIAGRGGTGAPGGNTGGSAVGGGRGMIVSVAVSIDNTSGIIAGGGGGGTGGAKSSNVTFTWERPSDGRTGSGYVAAGGGGGGGGQGGNVSSTGGAAGSAPEGFAYSGANLQGTSAGVGGAGSVSSAGGGGVAATCTYTGLYFNGSVFVSGTITASGTSGFPGGGWGQAGGASAAGECLSGNSYITWINTGTRYGVLT
jgi:hypothetical protein